MHEASFLRVERKVLVRQEEEALVFRIAREPVDAQLGDVEAFPFVSILLTL